MTETRQQHTERLNDHFDAMECFRGDLYRVETQVRALKSQFTTLSYAVIALGMLVGAAGALHALGY